MTTGSLYPDWEVPALPRVRRRGHAGQPGNGPEGETCKSCLHYAKIFSGGYRKCGLMEANWWAHGPGSGIRAKDPACEHWSTREDNHG